MFSMYASSEIKKRGNQIDFSQVKEMLHIEANPLPESCQACLLARGNSHTNSTHHKDLLHQPCGTSVAPLEHQSLFKVFLPNLRCTRTAHLRQQHNHIKRETHSKHSPTLPPVHLFFVVQKQRRRKHTRAHTHYILQSKPEPPTHTHQYLDTSLFFTLSTIQLLFFLSPTSPPVRAHLLPSLILIGWQEYRDKNTARTFGALYRCCPPLPQWMMGQMQSLISHPSGL